MSNLSEFPIECGILQQAESIDHFDALKRCLLSCDLSIDLSDMTTEQNKQLEQEGWLYRIKGKGTFIKVNAQ